MNLRAAPTNNQIVLLVAMKAQDALLRTTSAQVLPAIHLKRQTNEEYQDCKPVPQCYQILLVVAEVQEASCAPYVCAHVGCVSTRARRQVLELFCLVERLVG